MPTGGQIGAPLEYDDNTSVAMGDLSTNDFPIAVSNFNSVVSNVSVAVFITHPFDADLSLYLIGPDGTTVRLASSDGSSGQNFGTFCGNGSRTVFDDSGATSIDAGAAPYTNTYHPQQPLAVFKGKTGESVNGNWTLRVVDTFPGSVGVLRCWSLYLTPADCGPGSGVCALCPNTTISGALDPFSPVQPGRLVCNGVSSGCGGAPNCPGTILSGAEFYQDHVFQNGPTSACIAVTLTAPKANLYSAAYTGQYSPTFNQCTNLIGVAGDSTISPAVAAPSPTRSYSFSVAANQVFDVIVNGVNGSYGSYQLTVTGGSCEPVLHANNAPTGKVRLDWTTSAGGYLLESATNVSAPTWVGVTNAPVVNSGSYVVTNGASGTDKFYRLRKP
jgi:subtilisin-like proprotein convertase family protein